MRGRFDTLIAPRARSELPTPYFPEPASHAVVRDGSDARLALFADIPELADIRALLAAWHDDVMVVMPDKRDQYSSIDTTAANARRLYENGFSVSVSRVETAIPLLTEWLVDLADDLGIPARARRLCIVYASPDGTGASPHFDQNLNLTVQLRGVKRWRVAPNRHVAKPTARYAMNMDAVPADVQRYARDGLGELAEMPDDADEIDLRPGNLLILPRGTWHTTDAVGESLSLNFTFGPVSWASVVASALERELERHEAWREQACDPAAAARRLAEAAERLVRIDPAMLSTAPRYQLVAGAKIEVSTDGARAHVGVDTIDIDAEADLLPMLRWIGARAAPFTLAELAAAFPDGDELGPGLCRMLVDGDILSRA